MTTPAAHPRGDQDWVRVAALVDLPLRRLVDGRGTGSRRSRHTGDGFDIAGVRAFRDGDDVRRIDWSATARTGELHVRTTTAESAVRTLLAVDLSLNMSSGTARWKADAAADVAMLLGHAAARRGDQVAVATAATGTSPASSGVRAQRVLHDTLTSTASGSTAELAEQLVRGTRPSVPSGMVLIVTEMFSELFTSYADVLARVGSRHELVVVTIVDPAEIELPAIDASFTFRSPSSSASVVVDLGNDALRDAYRKAAADVVEHARQVVASAGGQFLIVPTDGDTIETTIRKFAMLDHGQVARR